LELVGVELVLIVEVESQQVKVGADKAWSFKVRRIVGVGDDRVIVALE
jgi:hypothetical protein